MRGPNALGKRSEGLNKENWGGERLPRGSKHFTEKGTGDTTSFEKKQGGRESWLQKGAAKGIKREGGTVGKKTTDQETACSVKPRNL